MGGREGGREGGVDTPWRKESNKVKIPKKEAKRDPTTALLRSAEEENRLSPVPLLLCAAVTPLQRKVLAHSQTQDAMRRPPPKSFCLASKQAARGRGGGGGLHSLYFICIPSHRIATRREREGGEGTQLLERKRIHKKAAEPIPSHRTRYYRYQALRGRQKGREGAGTESPAAPAACKACPMHAGTSWSCSPTYEKEGNMQMFRIKTLHGTRMR